MKKKNENEHDIKNRIRNHALVLERMQDRFKVLQATAFELEKKELVRHKKMTEIELDDFKRAEDHRMRIYGIDKEAEEVHGIVTDTYNELHGQGRRLREIGEDVSAYEHDLSLN